MSFGEHLRADQDIDLAVVDLRIQIRPVVFAAGAVPVHTGDACLRQQAAQGFFRPLRALPDGGQILIAAFAACVWDGLAEIAMVAAQLARALVQHHFGGTVRAAERVAAVATKQGGGESAAVQIHQRHAAALQVVFQQRQGLWREAVFQRQAAGVEQGDFGQFGGGIGAVRQRKQGVCAGFGFVPAFQARRGTAQHDGAAALFGAPHGQIAGVVTQIAVLFERVVVLFVHNQQPQIGHGREHRQSRADNQFGVSEQGAQVVLAALCGGGLAVQDGGGDVGKALGDAVQQLRR